ncbi:MAG TPA: hypothetical protein VGO03_21485 [Acidimicrobiia bacterium]|jgi:quinol monooxygenase YgiN
MSVLVIATMKADPADFERVHAERAADFRSVMQDALHAGVIHHRFAAGNDGTIIIVDEWPDAESFQKFFDHQVIASLMQDAGVQGPPEIAIYEVIDTVDQC